MMTSNIEMLLGGAVPGVSQRMSEAQGHPAASVPGWNGICAIGFRDGRERDVIGIS